MRYKLLAILVCFSLSACLALPYHTTDRAAIVILNKLENSLTYQAYMSSAWTGEITIAANEADFLHLYERRSKHENFPEGIDQIKINTPDCQLQLNREQLESFMVPDPDGRAGWNLYVNDELKREFGCAD